MHMNTTKNAGTHTHESVSARRGMHETAKKKQVRQRGVTRHLKRAKKTRSYLDSTMNSKSVAVSFSREIILPNQGDGISSINTHTFMRPCEVSKSPNTDDIISQ